MKSFVEATEELLEFRKMLIERQPAVQPAIDAMMTEAMAEVERLIQPLIDFGEGKISWEEYQALMAARHAQVQEERRRYYDMTIDGVVEVSCEYCGEAYDWVIEEHDDEWPPIYFECEDITGVDCQEEEEEES